MVIIRILLRQHERFVCLAVIVDIGQVWAGIQSVDTAAAENNPPAVVAPRRVAFYVFAVCPVQGLVFFCGQGKHKQVGILMPDGEVSIGRKCI